MPVDVDFRPISTTRSRSRSSAPRRVTVVDSRRERPEQDWNFPFEEPLHEVFPQLHAAQNAWMAQVDSLTAPDRKTHELIRMVGDRRAAQPRGRAAARAARARGRRDVGGDPRLDHAHRARATGCCPRSRRSRTRAPVTSKRAKPKPTSRTAGDAHDVVRSAVSHPAAARPTTTASSGRAARAGELRFWRCQDCGYYIHPPQPICPICHSKNLAVEAVSGRATLATYSINHQNWMPGPELPYVVAIVEIVEQPSVRLTTNLVNCPHDDDRDRHAGARDVRASPRSRRRRLPPAVRARRRRLMDANEIIERRACITRRRAVGDRPAARAAIRWS